MIKLKIEGTPEEIAAFLAHVEETDGLKQKWSTEITKRAESHQWGSALAAYDVEPIEGLQAEYSIYQRGKKGQDKPKSQARPGWVYVLPAYGPSGCVGFKIGKTLTPYSRRKTFGNKFYFEIAFVALISTANHTALETKLHQHYASKRMGRSEFFNLTEQDILDLQDMMSEEDKALMAKVNAALK